MIDSSVDVGNMGVGDELGNGDPDRRIPGSQSCDKRGQIGYGARCGLPLVGIIGAEMDQGDVREIIGDVVSDDHCHRISALAPIPLVLRVERPAHVGRPRGNTAKVARLRANKIRRDIAVDQQPPQTVAV